MKIQEHPWVTKRGLDPLISMEENTSDLVEPPTEEEMRRAITGNLSNLLVVVSLGILTHPAQTLTPSADESSEEIQGTFIQAAA